jgi:dCMP deaminase
MANWNLRFVELAKHVASWSKDESVKVGVIIADEDNRVVSIGYNGFPSGCDDSKTERYQRPMKYLYTEHGERNAIYNAARTGAKTFGCTMYLDWFPCADCARGVIQSGLKRLVCGKPNFEDERWGDSFKAAFEMLEEAKVEIVFHS